MTYHSVAVGATKIRAPLATLIPAVIAFTAGIFFSPQLTAHLPAITLWAIFATSAGAVFIAWRCRRLAISLTLLIPLFFTLGAIRAAPFAIPPTNPHDLHNQIDERREVTIAGILSQMPAIPPGRSRILIAAEQLILPDGTIMPSSGLAQITMQFPLPDDIEPGDRLLARAVLKHPRSFLTPGAFDYRQHLAGDNIRITGWISSPIFLQKLHLPTPPATIAQLRYLPERLRHRVGTFLAHSLAPQTGALYRALLLGDRSAVAPEIIENFTAAGCIHLLAISGTHMGLIALLTTVTVAWLLKRSTRLLLCLDVWKTAAALTLPVLFAYALLAGLQTPAVRALVMTTIFLCAILLDRQWSIPVNIAIAAFLLLIWKPPLLYTASFQLTFAAVIAITLLCPRLTEIFSAHPPGTATPAGHKLRSWLVTALAVSTAATVGVLPLQLLHFNRLSTLSPLATLLVEPFLCLWALAIGLLACLLLPVSPWLAGKLFSLGGIGINGALSLTKAMAALPFASVRLPTPTGTEICIYYLALLGFSQRHRFRLAMPLASASLLALVGSLCLTAAFASKSNILRVTVLDVGQGSATVLELPHNRAILLDGGSYLGDQFDVGERVIAPFLWQRRITRLEAVIVSHPHADHYNGLPFILKNFKPKTLWTNGQPVAAPEYQDLLQEARALGIAVRSPPAATPLYEDNRLRLDCLNPPPTKTDSNLSAQKKSPKKGANRHSLVLRLTYGAQSFLFPGDIDAEAERRLLEGGGKMATKVLLAPHHGSGGSLSDSFMAAVAPDYIVVSAGATRPGGMAEAGAVRKWRDNGATVFNTAEDGAVTLVSDGATLAATTTSQPRR
ncbi:MAG: DNA internalization-related competence protein ComEC/Rec2 [Desulfobulbaceae bacterium]|nr:DNA internalization-related competence protein ComEC/Rec2 [Desulfobulbaceae bacterium]